MIIALLIIIACVMLFGAEPVLSFLIGIIGIGLFLGVVGVVIGLIIAVVA